MIQDLFAAALFGFIGGIAAVAALRKIDHGCAHRWKAVGCAPNKISGTERSGGMLSSYVHKEFTHDGASLMERCEKCAEIRTRQLDGSWTLDDFRTPQELAARLVEGK